MVDLYWEKSTADAVLRLLSFILIVESFLLWIFAYSDPLTIFTGFVVFLIGDLGLLLGKTPFWNNLFDRDFHRVQKIQKTLGSGEERGIVEARLKPVRKVNKKRVKTRKKKKK